MTPRTKGVVIIACFSPRMLIYTGDRTPSGKPRYKMMAYDESACGKTFNGLPIITVPCGRCVGCRMEYAREWSNRLMLEKQLYDDSLCWFVTLTYDQCHLESILVVDHNGECKALSLCKRDLQLFIKRLRKAVDLKIRYFACGEYGDKSKRPHYHLILFGLPLGDLLPFGKNELGDQYFRSAFLEKLWPYGFVQVGKVTFNSCSYVARYILKKQYGVSASVYNSLGIEPEFVLMSRKPGIGYQYYEDHKDTLFDFDRLNISTEKGGKEITLPKYYMRKYAEENPQFIDDLKLKRRFFADENRKALELSTDLSYNKICKVKEINFKAKAKNVLERSKT